MCVLEFIIGVLCGIGICIGSLIGLVFLGAYLDERDEKRKFDEWLRQY
jgi:hypothetical protein